MANKKKRKEILEELGLTKKEMNEIWAYLITQVKEFKAMDKKGQDWKDLPGKVIRDLPETKRKIDHIYSLAGVARDFALLNRADEALNECEESEFCTDPEEELDWDEQILQKIDSGEDLTERELKELIFDGYEIYRSEGENRRWSRTIESVVEINDRTFCIMWEEGLTENQENEFYNQPFEVEKEEYEKTITAVRWNPVNKEPEKEEEFTAMNLPIFEEDEPELE